MVGHHGAGFKTEPGPPVLSRGGGTLSLQGCLPLVKRRAGSGRPGDGQLAPELWMGTGPPREVDGRRPQHRAGRAVGGWAEARLAVGLPARGSGGEDPARHRPAPPRLRRAPPAARASRGGRPAVRARRRRARPRAPAAVGRRASERACVRARAAAPRAALEPEATGLRRLLPAPAPAARCPLLPGARQPRPLPRPEDAGRVEGGRDAGPGGVHLGYPQL